MGSKLVENVINKKNEMFNIIFPIIIFVSLAVIVFITGKHLPEFVDIKKSKKNSQNPEKTNFLKKSLVFFKNVILWLFEKIIKKVGEFLELIHSWIVANKKSKKENISSEEKLREDENKKININKEKDISEKSLNKNKSSKKNFFSNFKEKFKSKLLERKRKKLDQVFQEDDEDFNENQFSDGIVSIREKGSGKDVSPEKLINEVVEVRKESGMSLDEEIGVDRNILEKKLIGKIAQNPREKETYRQLGELYLKMKNYPDAEGCYKQILKMSFRDIDARRKIERIKLLKRSKK